MVWEALLYVLSLLVSVYLLLSSRHLISYKRWYDFSFLQGLAFFCWGLGHLFLMHESKLFQLISHPLLFLFYCLYLLSFHIFPLSPHLYYERWKIVADTAILFGIYATITLCWWNYPIHAEQLLLALHIQCSLLILSLAITVTIANKRSSAQWKHTHLLLLSTMFFLLIDSTGSVLPQYLRFAFALAAFVIMGVSQHRMRGITDKLTVCDEHLYLYEKLQFNLLDANMIKAVFFFNAISLTLVPTLPVFYYMGMGLVLLLILIRLYVSQRQNRALMQETFLISSNLEKQFGQQLEQIQAKNNHLSSLITIKESYEKLLLSSNEQSLRDISYENLQQIIEELVDIWYTTMMGLAYIRVSLESVEGAVYDEVARGDTRLDKQMVTLYEQVVVDEQSDTSLSPRYVRLYALTTTEDGEERELEQSFFQLLVINVRGLIIRCLQDNQALELRLMEQEMELAAKIQLSLIPRDRLVLPYLQAKAVFIPVTYVGGDYVDYIRVDDRYTCFIVADISGHGIPASLLTTGIRSALRAVIQTCTSPELILERLNRLLYEDLATTRSFITMLVAVHDHWENKLRISRAGHPQPLYISASKQCILPCSKGLGLGLSKETSYLVDEWSIDENFLLLIYTDGLTELGRKEFARDAKDWLELFHRSIDLKRNSSRDRIETIEQCIWEVRSDHQQLDDISVLLIEMEPVVNT